MITLHKPCRVMQCCMVILCALLASSGAALQAEDTLDLLWRHTLPPNMGSIAFSLDNAQYALSKRDTSVVIRVSAADGRVRDTLYGGKSAEQSQQGRTIVSSLAFLGERLILAVQLPNARPQFECYDRDSVQPRAVCAYSPSGMFPKAFNVVSLPTTDSMLFAEGSTTDFGNYRQWSTRTGFLALRAKDSIEWWTDDRQFYVHDPQRSYDGWIFASPVADASGEGVSVRIMDVRSRDIAKQCASRYSPSDAPARSAHPTGNDLQTLVRLRGGAVRLLDSRTCSVLPFDDVEPVLNIGRNGVMLARDTPTDSLVVFRVVDLVTMRTRELARFRTGPYFCLDRAFVTSDRLYIAYDTTLLCFRIRRSSVDTSVALILSSDSATVGGVVRATVKLHDARRSASYRWFANDVMLAQTSTASYDTYQSFEGSYHYAVEVQDSSGSVIARGRALRPLVVTRSADNLYQQPLRSNSFYGLSLSASGRYLAVGTWDSVFVVALHDTGAYVAPHIIARRGHGVGVFKPGTDTLMWCTTSFVRTAAPSSEIRFDLSVGVPPLFASTPVTSFTIADSNAWRSAEVNVRTLQTHLFFDEWSKHWIVGAAGIWNYTNGESLFLGALDPQRASDGISWFVEERASVRATKSRLLDISAGPAPWVGLCFDSTLRGIDVDRGVDTTFMVHERPNIVARFVGPNMVLTTIGVYRNANDRWESGGYFPTRELAFTIIPSTDHAFIVSQDSKQFGYLIDLQTMSIRQRLRSPFPYPGQHVVYDSVRHAVHVTGPSAAVSGWKLVDLPVTSVDAWKPQPKAPMIQLRPNPATDHVSVSGLLPASIIRAEAIDVLGRVFPLVISSDVVLVSALPEGVYMLRVVGVGGDATSFLSIAR